MEGCGDCEDTNTPAMVSWVVLSKEVEVVEEVGSKDRPTNICYHKNPGKRAPETQVEGERLSSKCGNTQAIGSLECGWGCFLSVGAGGSTLTAAPVSTRNVR